MTLISSEIVRKSGLDLKKIELHYKRVEEFTKSQNLQKYKIIAPCTPENTGVIDRQKVLTFLAPEEKWSDRLTKQCKETGTVILAAGAATRFFEALTKFCRDFESATQIRNEVIEEWTEEIDQEVIESQHSIFRKSESVIPDEFENSEIIFELMERITSKDVFAEWRIKASRLLNNVQINSNGQVSKNSLLETYILTKIFLKRYSGYPKAVVPITQTSETLLSQNIRQQQNFCSCGDLFIVVGHGTEEMFDAEVNRTKIELLNHAVIGIADFKCTLITQGPENSTIRFSESAEPVLEDDGRYSVVAGGHGEIINYFNGISDSSPEIKCLHVRTIDNIFGESKAVTDELRKLSSFFFELKRQLDELRCEIHSLVDQQLTSETTHSIKSPKALKAYERILKLTAPRISDKNSTRSQSVFSPVTIDHMYTTLEKIFCWPEWSKNGTTIETLTKMTKLMMRPLTVFGVVPIKDDDVGGIPVFAQNELGELYKICVESAHIRDSDRQMILSQNQEKGHFNSALIFVETEMQQSDGEESKCQQRVNFNELVASDVFLIAKKQHKGENVLYHELAMFEILSHSELVNSVFVEIPRALFKPNKSILDTVIPDK